MAYGFIEDVPADEHIYGQIRALLGDEPPKGLIAHVAVKREGGLRYVDVWETKADWDRFHNETLDPAVEKVLASMGLPVDPSLVQYEEVDVVDAWIAAPAPAVAPA